MKVQEKIKLLRELMKKNQLDAYIIPTFDAHQSEYVAEHWNSRVWISGFTGSAGTFVVTKEESGLWTDGRYFIQAEKQLKGSEIKLFKMGQPNVPTYIEWIERVLDKNAVVGIDGKVFPRSIVKEMEDKFTNKAIKINSEHDLIDLIWKDRPQIPMNKIFIHDVKYAGKSRIDKINELRAKMREKGADYYLLASLDDIAWLYNIRGEDVSNNPVAICYVLISMEKSYLFIAEEKVTDQVRNELEKDGIVIKDYEDIEKMLCKFKKDERIFLDPNKTNIWLYNAIPSECKKIEESNITTVMKAVKNDVELENLKKCQLRDGVAMAKFLYWLKNNVGKEKITEISASDKLKSFRAEQENFMDLSFDTIAGYKEHAAMMHYKATKESDYELKKEGSLLVDSGGQYLDGTTDITRTFILGDISKEEKYDFTLVLKGHIALATAKFLYGSTGANLDILARKPLWEQGIDYKCGTGHGVGFFLNVHEGPQNISPRLINVKLEKGMITTNEPGVYKEGKYGIRTENVMLTVEDRETEFGQFMKFEVMSYCPIDLDGIDVDMLTSKEKDWLNNYHSKVYKKISPYLNNEEKSWLKRETREI